jgi:hypothetical protein
MSYIETVIGSVNPDASFPPASREVVEHALSLRDSSEVLEASSAASYALELDQLSETNQNLFQTRIFGGLAVKLALTSHFSTEPGLSRLSPDDQLEELENLTNRYAVTNRNVDLYALLAAPSQRNDLSSIPNALVRSWVYDARNAEVSFKDRLKAIEAYINVTPGTFPPKPYAIKPMGDNDTTLIQAFGRDTFTDAELVMIKKTREALGNDTTMMEFLRDKQFEPGHSNIDLAKKMAENLTSEAPIEQIAQWEVVFALYRDYPEIYASYRHYIHTLWPHSGFYPTYEVKKDSVDVMDKFGLYNAQELAHPDMMARAVGILEKLGVQPDPIAADVRYDPGSTQAHVRDAEAFKGRERLARIEHVLRGRVRF